MKEKDKVNGAEGIVIHNGNVVLGMQKPYRWYDLQNGKQAAIIKTLGGEVENIDNNSTKNAFLREVLEEVKGLKKENLRISRGPVFTKHIYMKELNPYEKESKLNLQADFYILEILDSNNIEPNDLPALIEIPIEQFMNLDFSKNQDIKNIQDYIVANRNISHLPENYAIMAPKDIKYFLSRFYISKEVMKDDER